MARAAYPLHGFTGNVFSFGEGTVNDWIPVVFTDGIGVDDSLGILALALFLGCVLAGRIVGPFAISRWGRVRVLLVLVPLVIVGSLLVVCGGGYLPFLGVALWGLGGSLGIPIAVSAAADDPNKAPARLSVVSTISFSSFLWGPLLVGFLGDNVGVRQALLAVTVMAGLAMGLLPATKVRS
ncbi:MFS transporter [Actinomycetaceae bacterium WB03_NA08]|uniref:MFS transporter n=1 Tax=Scrofimicrobium canadense TaxID=2652290 RepID=A0A6N7W4L3_9ACTO|nr:hypothetical protein [Scrofimicrobium canadense]MSS83392.1 MFS transporter [Scrofimicrobium canadense]